jgi:hypothetical protein
MKFLRDKLGASAAARAVLIDPPPEQTDEESEFDIPEMSVWKRTTVAEAQAHLGDWDRWVALRRIIEPGDELYWFSTSHDSWRHLAGRSGYALVRNGEIIADIVTRMN